MSCSVSGLFISTTSTTAREHQRRARGGGGDCHSDSDLAVTVRVTVPRRHGDRDSKRH